MKERQESRTPTCWEEGEASDGKRELRRLFDFTMRLCVRRGRAFLRRRRQINFMAFFVSLYSLANYATGIIMYRFIRTKPREEKWHYF